MYKNTLRNIVYPLIVAVAMVGGVYMGRLSRPASMGGNQPARTSKSYGDNKLMYTLSLIDRAYVDSVSLDSLTEKLMPELIDQLDPHSAYIPATDYASVNEALDGEFDGVGIVFNMATDTIVVLNVVPGGPSEKAGVINGDRVIMIDDSVVAGKKIPQDQVVKMLRGKRGSQVKLSLERMGLPTLVPVEVTRGVIPIKSLTAAFMLEPGVGYVKLAAFSRNSHAELTEALARLSDEGMRKLIFDLRDNSGGFLGQAISIANEFLPANTLIVYTEDRFQRREMQYSDGKGKYADLDLAVLINEYSASSSEILAGAIQDNDRGAVIGRRSFGKGLVQEQFDFSDGSALRLTIARYYTPTGRSIQRPYASGNEQYNMELMERVMHNELFVKDSIKFDDSQKFVTPRGKTVYGGGGIMPDIFVPLDTTHMSTYYKQVAGLNILYRFTMEYSDRHREELNNIRTIEELNAFLDKDTNLLRDFVAYASANGVKPDMAGISYSEDVIKAQIRAYVGRNSTLDDSGFISQIYRIDDVMKTAIDELKSN